VSLLDQHCSQLMVEQAPGDGIGEGERHHNQAVDVPGDRQGGQGVAAQRGRLLVVEHDLIRLLAQGGDHPVETLLKRGVAGEGRHHADAPDALAGARGGLGLRHKAKLVDHGEDVGQGGGLHALRGVEHIRYRGDAYAGLLCHIVDGDVGHSTVSHWCS
jgi:hypothetical protein